jgi:hypothetical protein
LVVPCAACDWIRNTPLPSVFPASLPANLRQHVLQCCLTGPDPAAPAWPGCYFLQGAQQPC